MTREERVRKLRYLITCMKCEVSGNVCDDNCPTQYNAGNTGEIIENLEEIAKTLEQESRSIIEKLPEYDKDYPVTIEEAKEYLRLIKKGICFSGVIDNPSREATSFDMAIKALSAIGTIPDNATNGDVFKAVFSAKEIGVDMWSHSMGVSINDDYDRYFNLDWWNAPYKVESEVKE